jgi:septal ring factor EnvC (AmiA/AmiB activator)
LSLRARTLLAVLATFAAATSLVPLRAIADDEHDDLSRTQDQLSGIEGVLRDARADASALSTALTSANEEVSLAEARLEQARNREATARLNRLQAAASLAEVQAEIKRTEGRLAQQARDAYMTGGMADLAALVDSQDLSVLADRAITLNYVAADGADTLSRLDMARRRADMLHQQMVQVERERVAATEAVSSQVTDLRKVRAVRQQAKQALDAKISRLAGQAASLRAHSTELRRLIQQEEAARAREAAARRASAAATSTTSPAAPAAPAPPAPSDPAPSVPLRDGRCDLSGTSAAERWIIMHESSGDPTADNPTSTAFGLGQLLLGNRILYLGKDYATTDCGKQLAAFRTYVRERYGTAEAAQAFWQSHGWY